MTQARSETGPGSGTTEPAPKVTAVGFNGMLVQFSDHLTEGANRAALAFRAAVDGLSLDGVTETSTALTSTFVLYDPMVLSQDHLRARLTDLLAGKDWAHGALPQDRKLWRIPALFEGAGAPQLAEAAALAEVSPRQAIEELCSVDLRVMTLGFAPGQPYLGALSQNWDIPRQSGLTKEVPLGAITVAIRQIVLFATPSPTGWRQVGLCKFRSFRPDAPEPFALRPGDAVRFHPVNPDAFGQITGPDGGATWEALT